MKKITILVAFFCIVATAFCQRATFREYGFYGTASYNFSTNLNRKDYQSLLNGITLTGGFQIRPKTCIELGVGFLADSKGVFTQVPITVGLRTHYLNNWITPFTDLYAGYSLPLKTLGSDADGHRMKVGQGGVTVGVNVGARISMSHKWAINAYVGWHFFMVNDLEVYTADNFPIAKDVFGAQCLKIGLGVMF